MTDVHTLLSRELDPARVLWDPDVIERYGHDESEALPRVPDCVVLATSAQECAIVLRLAAEHRVPVTPRGAGSGRSGGAIPVRGGIVLSTERMTKILEIDKRDLVAVVEPGVITGDLHRAVEAQGLFYPPDPASLSWCSLGGNVAHNAGGPRAFKYGVTRNFVLGLDTTLMGGEALRFGRRSPKGVTGYDLTQTFVGSEGTFGVTTQITLRLLPLPPGVTTLLVIFPSVETAGNAITQLLGQGFMPRALELVDATCIALMRDRYPFPSGAGAAVLLELDGELDSLESQAMRAGAVCEGAGAIECLVAKDDQDRQRLWNARRLLSPVLKERFKLKVGEDVCVPRGQIPELLRRATAIGPRFDLSVATYGHAGDGNLHVNFLSEEDPRENHALHARVESALESLFKEVCALGGTLTGEHGVGLTKQRFLPLEQPQALRDWQVRLKRLWDPLDLMNPGKIFPA